MATDNLARGSFNFANLPFLGHGAGVSTDYGVLLPPGSRVAAYVRASAADYDDASIAKRRVTTLAAGLKQCRANKGDVVVVLPGHSESVTDNTMLTNLTAGTKVIGVGHGSDMPTFRWTNTAGSWLVDDANCIFTGLRLRMEGANGITKGIVVTAADCVLKGCDIEVASGATAKAAIGIEIGSAAHRCWILSNVVRGTATHNMTDCIKVVGATPPSDVRICGNEMVASVTADNGLIHVTVAALGMRIVGNDLYNTHTSSTACIKLDDVAADGLVAYNTLATTVGTGTAPASAGIVLAGTSTLFRFFENYSTPTKNTSGIICPVVDS
jgi:hypothetical protein